MYSTPATPSSPPRYNSRSARSGRLHHSAPLPSPPTQLSASGSTMEQPSSHQSYFPAPQRGPCSPDGDEKLSLSNNSPPTRSRHGAENKRLSGNGLGGPRLPPLPLGSPLTVENSLYERRLSSASAGSRRGPRYSHLSVELRSASPIANNRMSTYSFLDGPPPEPSESRYSRGLDSPDSPRRPSLMPRPAVRTSDCFGLDFSFLDDEPPPRPNFSTRRSISDSLPFGRAPSGPPSARWRISAGSDLTTLGTPDSPARSFSSGQSLPFPSRPRNVRTASTDYVLAAERDARAPYNPGTFVPGQNLGAPLDDTRRPSVVSSFSMESTDSSAPSVGFGSVVPSDTESPTSSTFSSKSKAEPEPETLEKRKRLAAFLDQTAKAMEGGRSLAMVLPEVRATDSEPAKSMSELAESISPRLPSAIEYRHPFASSFAAPSICVASDAGSPSPKAGSRSPRDRSQSPRGSRVEFALPTPAGSSPATPTAPSVARARSPVNSQNRHTVYFTPDPSSAGSDDGNESDASEQAGGTSGREADVSATPSLTRNGSTGGLGFNIDIDTQSTLSNIRPGPADRSPSTLHAESPVVSLRPSFETVPAISAEVAQAMEKRAKIAEKRKRTIGELIDTEASYATDMIVVRDIYLARAKGVDIGTIADRVMDSGLGLGSTLSSPPPPLPTRSTHGSPAAFANGLAPALTRGELRRSSTAPYDARRPSSAPSFSAKLEQRRATLAATRIESTPPTQALLSSKDLHIVFANLEEVAGLAQTFAEVLEGAKGSGTEEEDDRIGEVFVQMMSRIEKVYSTYCSRHDRAIGRLAELEPSLRGYIAECKTLSHGRTGAWDLGSLLIKPVQRCLKYPMLLDQILSMTPETHPDRLFLQAANEKMLGVAEHINEQKQRHRQVDRLAPKKDLSLRRESTRSLSSAVTKKFLRASASKPNKPNAGEAAERDDMFDTYAHLVDSTRSSVLRFSNEMRDWSRTTKAGLEAQVTMVDGWIELYSPVADNSDSSPYHRLCIFLEEVLDPIIDGPWRELDVEIRRSLLLKTDHLLSLFESPRQFIAKRNDKMLEHSRYLAKKLPADRRGSEEFVDLTNRLLEELPRFLNSVSRYYDIIVGHFHGAQEAYHEAVQERWEGFSEQFDLSSDSPVPQYQATADIMNRLAVGLGVAATSSTVTSPAARKRISRISGVSHGSPVSSQRNSLPASVDERRRPHPSSTAENPRLPPATGARGNRSSVLTNRSSAASDSSAPSLAFSSNGGGSSNGQPVTPPPLSASSSYSHLKSSPMKEPGNVHRHSTGNQRSSTHFDHRRPSLASRYEAPLPSVPIHEIESASGSEGSSAGAKAPSSVVTFREPEAPSRQTYDSDKDVARPRSALGRQDISSGGESGSESDSNFLSTYSVYVEAGEGFDHSDDADADDDDDQGETLYTAEAMCDSPGPKSLTYRSGFPIISFKMGERIDVILEEADRAEGGAGWLLGRTAKGELGFVRTEHFMMLDDEV